MDDNNNANKENSGEPENIENQEELEKTEEIEDINGETDFGDEDDPLNQELKDPELPDIAVTEEMEGVDYFTGGDYKKRFAEMAFDWVEIFASAFLTVILLFTFILRLVTVDGPSMQETLHKSDNLIISHLFYKPQQGDIVVIEVPNKQQDKPIIKRVIATEGQTIEFDFDNWLVKVDGVLLDEPYVNYEFGKAMKNESISRENPVIKVEPGKIFVMGDNRNNSLDSRDSSIGQVEVRNVVGRVLIRIFPLNKFGFVKPNES